MSLKRKCPAHGCPIKIDRDRVFCRRHWYSLPAQLRGQIWRAYHKARGSQKHLRLLAAAIRFVNQAPAEETLDA